MLTFFLPIFKSLIHSYALSSIWKYFKPIFLLYIKNVNQFNILKI